MVPVIVIDQMSRQQQDKSKGNLVFSPTIQTYNPIEMLPIMPQPIIPSPQLTFFDKFKNPDSFRRSAFRLCHPASPQSEQPSTPKKSSIIRKHRGNYRKYTVGEKEQAVKQILEGVDAKEISQKYGIPRRNLLRWKKNGCERKEGGGRPTDGEMQLTLYTKIDGKILVTEKEIRAEAKRLSKMADFKASKGWYCKFSRRYNQWKKQERERAINADGSSIGEDKEVFLLPEVDEESDSESDSFKSSSLAKQQE